MKRMAYGDWVSMINESIVRAAGVRYLESAQGHEAARLQVRQELDRGSLWMEGLSQRAFFLRDFGAGNRVVVEQMIQTCHPI